MRTEPNLTGKDFIKLGIIFITAAITLYLLFLIGISYKQIDQEWLKEGASMIIIILAELGAVTIILEERLRNHFQTQYAKLKEIIEIERREGRKYVITEKIMEFQYEPTTKTIKYTEINDISFLEPGIKELLYPIYYDIKKEITNTHINQNCPRVKACIIDEENLAQELTLRDLSINGSMLTAFINPTIAQDRLRLKIDRCYKQDELDTYFVRMIQDPVYQITIKLDWNILEHLMNLNKETDEVSIKQALLRRIKIVNHEMKDAATLFKKEIKITRNGATIKLTPYTDKRPRFYIMDKIQILIGEKK